MKTRLMTPSTLGIYHLIHLIPKWRRINYIIIHQIFSLARDWCKRVTWANIPQLKVGNIRGYSPIFKTDG